MLQMGSLFDGGRRVEADFRGFEYHNATKAARGYGPRASPHKQRVAAARADTPSCAAPHGGGYALTRVVRRG